MGKRSQVKRVDTKEVETSNTIENRVSGVDKVKSDKTWWAKDLLRLTASFITEDHKRKEREKSWRPKSYSSGRHIDNPEEKYVRAALRVASHEKFKDYEIAFYQVYVIMDIQPDPFVVERMSEFEMALDASLDKTPFEAERREGRSDEAKDLLDVLIPITTCAKYLGVHRSTLHRWIPAGLGNEMVGPYPAVIQQGKQIFVNYLVALKWKYEHHQPHRNPKGQAKTKGAKVA